MNLNGRCKDSRGSRTIPSMDLSHGHCSSAWSDDDGAPGSPDKLSTILLTRDPDSLPEMSPSKESSSLYNDESVARDVSEEEHEDRSKILFTNHSQEVDSSLPGEKSSWDDDIGSPAMLAPEENHAGVIPYEFSVSKASSTLVSPKESNGEGLLSRPYPIFDHLNQSVSFPRAVGSCSHSNENLRNFPSQMSVQNLDIQDSVSNVLGNFRRSEGWKQLCTENGVENLNPRDYSDASSNGQGGTLATEDFRTVGIELIDKTIHQSNRPEEAENFGEYARYSGRLHNPPSGKNAFLDRGESNIISNILSMDFDPWSDASVSTGSFAKFLGESNEQNGGLKMTALWKGQSNESRFSFARQEIQQSFSRTPLCEVSQVPGSSSLGIQNCFMPTSSRYPGSFNEGQFTNLAEKSAGKYTCLFVVKD